jgi:hypothetical protein
MFFQVAEERVPRRIGHSSGTSITGHEWGEVTIEWCLRERGIVVVIIVTGNGKTGDVKRARLVIVVG